MQAKILSERGTIVGKIKSFSHSNGSLGFLVRTGDFGEEKSIRQMVRFLRVIYALGGRIVRC
jgi:hypothetical protein